MLTDEQKNCAMLAFESLDERRKGTLDSDMETLTHALRLAGLNPTRHQMEQLMAGTDLGETVTREEFLSLAALLEWPSVDVTRQTLARDFALFIGDHADTISDGELIHILTREGRETLTSEEAARIVGKFDLDAQGDLSLHTLIEHLLALNPV